MSKNYTYVIPGRTARGWGRIARLLGLSTSKLQIEPATQQIVDRLRSIGCRDVAAPHFGGKSMALLVYARELMPFGQCPKVVILVPYAEMTETLAAYWRRSFPYERSPLFTNDVRVVRWLDIRYYLMDDAEHFTPEDLATLQEYGGCARFYGSVITEKSS